MTPRDVIDEDDLESDGGDEPMEKAVQYKKWENRGHIELKDLTEKDFLGMIEAKHSELRHFWYVEAAVREHGAEDNYDPL